MKNKLLYIIIAIIIILGIGLITFFYPKIGTVPSETDTTTEQVSDTSSDSEHVPDNSSETGSETTTETSTDSEVPSESETTTETDSNSEEPASSETEKPTEKPTESEKPTETEKPSESQKPSESDTSTENPGGNGDVTDEPVEPEKPKYTYKDLDKTMYATGTVNVRDLPTSDGKKLGSLTQGAEVKVTGQCNETNWYRIDFDGKVAYVSNKYLTTEKPKEETGDNDGLPSGYSWEDRDGDGFADLPDFTEMGGMLVYTKDVSPEYALFQKQLSEAGMFVVMEFNEDFFVLAPTTDEARTCMNEWLKERGLAVKYAGGGNWTKDEKVKFYQVYETKEYIDLGDREFE